MPSTVEIHIRNEQAREKARPGGSWNPGDFVLFDSQKAMAKVRKNLNGLRHNFNFHINVGTAVTDKYPSRLEVKGDAINVCFFNNVTSQENWIPMTSWILLHRLSHCFVTGHGPDADGLFDDSFTRYDGPEAALLMGLDDLWFDAYVGTKHTTSPYYVRRKTRLRDVKKSDQGFSCMGVDNSYRIGFMALHFMTMRSAREKALSNELDIFAEAFAQFLHTGKFRLNRWEDSGIEALGHTDNLPKNNRTQMQWGLGLGQDLTRRVIPIAVLNEQIAQIEADVNAKMEILATRMVGKTFAF